MAKQLLAKIDDAIAQEKVVEDLGLAIVRLSKYEAATEMLILAYRDALLDDEKQWQELEAQPDYSYSNRAAAVKDYLRRHGD